MGAGRHAAVLTACRRIAACAATSAFQSGRLGICGMDHAPNMNPGGSDALEAAGSSTAQTLTYVNDFQSAALPVNTIAEP
jgi:hypothetical protein